MAAPRDHGLGGARQVDPIPGCAPEMRLPFSVAGRGGHSPRIRRCGLCRASADPGVHVWGSA
eukprot:14443742-Alexandrium_andersonii.AAC.1